jgi:hypothetical protein
MTNKVAFFDTDIHSDFDSFSLLLFRRKFIVT